MSPRAFRRAQMLLARLQGPARRRRINELRSIERMGGQQACLARALLVCELAAADNDSRLRREYIVLHRVGAAKRRSLRVPRRGREVRARASRRSPVRAARGCSAGGDPPGIDEPSGLDAGRLLGGGEKCH